MKAGLFQNSRGGWSMILPTGEIIGNYSDVERARQVAEVYNGYETYVCETIEIDSEHENKAHFGKCPSCGCGFVIFNNSHANGVHFEAKICPDACEHCRKYAVLEMYQIIKSKIGDSERDILKGANA